MPTEPYALCPMPHALCPVVPHLSEKGYILTIFTNASVGIELFSLNSGEDRV
jgi:hypothetical protein